ncbi:MAG: hypothetical protein B6245_18620 [Desulfobacteraceae bacterium 4572_88]|nr:MAG: hypothetical protein B6245_18620 [Desulfobacteraceae bacterium 4572_88]
MRKSAFTAIHVGLLLLISPVFTFASSPEGHKEYWISIHGALSEKDHPLVSEVRKVFDRVLAAADKRASRFPNLVILRQAGNPWAMSLKDGTVLLTQKAMELCYRDTKKEIGDARTAFVLGHELAHLSQDHFWHTAAFEAVRKFGQNRKAVQDILELLCKTENIQDTAQAREIIRKKELQADGYGMLYASMAGYDPGIIVNDKGGNFFREWADQITERMACDDGLHPTPEKRAAFLLSNMRAVSDKLNLFDLGVRLFQLGRYEDALNFLEEFRKDFPCREVFSNIGLIHYQTAMKILDRCDWNSAYRYRLSTVADTETLAVMLDMETRGRLLRREKQPADRGACMQAPAFRERIKEAIRHLKVACEKDRAYMPARVNLSSAHILIGKYSDAMAILDEALKIGKDDPKALNNRAIAMYLLGPSIHADMFQQAYTALRVVSEKYPNFPDAFYNLSRILSERKRNAAAGEVWERFLSLESMGVYAEMARETLGTGEHLPDTPGIEHASRKSGFHEPSPVRLGDMDEKTEEKLAGLERHDLELGRVFGTCHVGENLRVLALEGVVELVEYAVGKTMALPEINSGYGSPRRTFVSPSGTRTLVYEDFAVDVRDDEVLKIIYFVGEKR